MAYSVGGGKGGGKKKVKNKKKPDYSQGALGTPF